MNWIKYVLDTFSVMKVILNDVWVILVLKFETNEIGILYVLKRLNIALNQAL